MAAAETQTLESTSRRRPAARRPTPLWGRVAKHGGPYLLILPSLVVIGVIMAWPLYQLFVLAFQKFGLPQILHMSHPKAGKAPEWVGFHNFSQAFHDPQFWDTLQRTVIFTAVNVGATLVIGTAIAVLMMRVAKPIRLIMTAVLIFVWAMPQLVALTIWNWLFDQEFGVVNYVLTKLHFGNFLHHNWYAEPWQGFMIVTFVVVWGAIPFIAITMHAALTQVPDELVEAARVDGASPWQVFRNVMLPILRPIIVILTSLSIIWDFQVFTQVYILRDNRPEPWYYLISIFSFVTSFKAHDYGYGSALAVITLFIMAFVSIFYIRQLIKISEDQ
jgi:N,N'-diacetylchitobiose transport system permease protein